MKKHTIEVEVDINQTFYENINLYDYTDEIKEFIKDNPDDFTDNEKNIVVLNELLDLNFITLPFELANCLNAFKKLTTHDIDHIIVETTEDNKITSFASTNGYFVVKITIAPETKQKNSFLLKQILTSCDKRSIRISDYVKDDNLVQSFYDIFIIDSLENNTKLAKFPDYNKEFRSITVLEDFEIVDVGNIKGYECSKINDTKAQKKFLDYVKELKNICNLKLCNALETTRLNFLGEYKGMKVEILVMPLKC